MVVFRDIFAGILRLHNRNIAKVIFRPKFWKIHEIDIARSIFRSKISENHDFWEIFGLFDHRDYPYVFDS